jgi:hypothetical protein
MSALLGQRHVHTHPGVLSHHVYIPSLSSLLAHRKCKVIQGSEITNDSYRPTTRTPTITSINTFDAIHRPTPRPITMSNDESRLYYGREDQEDEKPVPIDKKVLKFFTGKEGLRAGRDADGDGAERQRKYSRDEL